MTGDLHRAFRLAGDLSCDRRKRANAAKPQMGGLSSRTVRLDLTIGLVTVKTPGANPCPL